MTTHTSKYGPRIAAFLSAAIALCLLAPAQYSVSSSVGPYSVPAGAPTSTGGGVWPSALPAGGNMTSIALATPVPATALNIKRVVLNSLTHTNSGELHFVLRAPSGAAFTLVHRPNFMNADTIKGQRCDYNGNYVVVDPLATGSLSWPANSSACTSTAILTPGQYPQYYGSVSSGTWPTGMHGIANSSFNSLPYIEVGLWRLEIYDWATGDSGSIMSWRLEGDTVGSPTSYCTSGTSAAGCVPTISAANQPSASFANPCTIAVLNADRQRNGLIFYGIDNTGFTPAPWGTGYLCTKAPVQRTPIQNTGGGTQACSGSLVIDWNAFLLSDPGALGAPFTTGRKVFAQGWYRDPVSHKVSTRSNALELTYLP